MAVPAPIVIGYCTFGTEPDPTCQQKGYLYPPNPAVWPGQRPWVVCTRAGGYVDGGAGESDTMLTDLQTEGYYCMFFDVRLVKNLTTGIGGLPGQTTDGKWPQQGDDYWLGVTYARAHALCNGFVACAGGSGSGGHAAWALLTGVAGSTRPDAGILLSAQLDASDIETDVPQTFKNKVQTYFKTSDGPTLRARSAISAVHSGQPRLYLANGTVENMPYSIFTRFRNEMAGEVPPVTNYDYHINLEYLPPPQETKQRHSFGTWPENKGTALASLATAYAEWQGAPPPPPPPPPQITSPSGIIGGGLTSWTNSSAQGRYKKYYWKNIQPNPGPTGYDWTDLDEQLALAATNGKQFTVLLNLCSGDPSAGINGLPAWLVALQTPWNAYDQNHGVYTYSYLPWDAIFKQYALLFIAAFCDRYDGALASVSMGGLGTTTEFGTPLNGNPILGPDGKTVAQTEAAWLPAAAEITAMYAAHLKKTVFTAAMGNPSTGDTGLTTLQTYVDNALALYGIRLGFENWGLNAASSQSFLPNKIIYNHRLTNSVGFQMTGNETTGGGGNLCGQSGGYTPPCLRAAMDAGVALGAQYLQVFGDDIDNTTAYGADFIAVRANLLPPPPALEQLNVVISAVPQTGAPPLTVQFGSTVTGGQAPYTYAWIFGDGGTSALANPSHTYAAGTWIAKCTVTDTSSPVQSVFATLTISSTAQPPPFSVSIAAVPSSGPPPLVVAFDANAVGAGGHAVTYAWTFGDGGTSSLKNPSHTYSIVGDYAVKVTATDSVDGRTASASATITVTALPPPETGARILLQH